MKIPTRKELSEIQYKLRLACVRRRDIMKSFRLWDLKIRLLQYKVNEMKLSYNLTKREKSRNSTKFQKRK